MKQVQIQFAKRVFVGALLVATGCAGTKNHDFYAIPNQADASVVMQAKKDLLNRTKKTPLETTSALDSSQQSAIQTVAFQEDETPTQPNSLPQKVSDNSILPRPENPISTARYQRFVAADSDVDVPQLSFESTADSMMEPGALTSPNVPLSLSLADIEQIALANNPAIAAAFSSAQVAAGLRRQVGTYPNPTIGYSGSQLADQQTDQHVAFIEQEFVRGNKLALNQQVLEHTTRAQQWEAETQRYRVLTDVHLRFYEALAAQWQLDATHDFAAVAQQGVNVAEKRKTAGEGTLIEVLQSETLLSETNLAMEQARAAYHGAWADLAAIAGLDQTQPAMLAAEFHSPEIAPNWDNTFHEIASQSPELATAKAIVCEKRANLQRQQAQAIPNITGQLGAGYDRGTDNGLINIQISAPIPIRNKNCGNISAAQAEYTRALENVQRIEQGIKSRLARAIQQYDSAFVAVRKYDQEIIPQAKKTLDLSEAGYSAGELDFLQVLVVRRTYYDATIKLIAAQGKLAQANAMIDGLLLVGGLDAPADYTSGDGLRGQSFGGQ